MIISHTVLPCVYNETCALYKDKFWSYNYETVFDLCKINVLTKHVCLSYTNERFLKQGNI